MHMVYQVLARRCVAPDPRDASRLHFRRPTARRWHNGRHSTLPPVAATRRANQHHRRLSRQGTSLNYRCAMDKADPHPLNRLLWRRGDDSAPGGRHGSPDAPNRLSREVDLPRHREHAQPQRITTTLTSPTSWLCSVSSNMRQRAWSLASLPLLRARGERFDPRMLWVLRCSRSLWDNIIVGNRKLLGKSTWACRSSRKSWLGQSCKYSLWIKREKTSV